MDITIATQDALPPGVTLTVNGTRYISRPMETAEPECDPIAFSQRNPHWSGIQLGASTYTIGSAGCAVTAAAMLGTLAEQALTPGTLTMRLNATDGFTHDGLLVWYKVAEAVEGLEYVIYSKWRIGPANLQAIRDALARGPQVLQVDFKPQTSPLDTHFVLGLRMTEDGGDIEIIDPYTGNRGTLLGMYAREDWDLSRAVYALAEFKMTR